MAIEIKWLGHSCFLVECQGYRILLDPFEPGSVPGFRDIHETVDQVLCSHEHHDHNYRAGAVLRQDGAENPFTITPLPSFHDDCQGAKRGPNTIHLLEADGLRVAHMGDVGQMPAPEVMDQLKGLDAVMLPVGGFYTVGPKEAKAIADALEAKVVIPMHYRSDSFGFDVLGPVEDYLDLDSHWMRYDTDTIEIHQNMHHSVAVLTYQS
ncbi:MAG: MBL fold metallo-hydrolase [Acutalibacter sp.]|jgi:L-ascorbate metabolism protein UlaG (beta-lactamase superfamily)